MGVIKLLFVCRGTPVEWNADNAQEAFLVVAALAGKIEPAAFLAAINPNYVALAERLVKACMGVAS